MDRTLTTQLTQASRLLAAQQRSGWLIPEAYALLTGALDPYVDDVAQSLRAPRERTSLYRKGIRHIAPMVSVIRRIPLWHRGKVVPVRIPLWHGQDHAPSRFSLWRKGILSFLGRAILSPASARIPLSLPHTPRGYPEPPRIPLSHKDIPEIPLSHKDILAGRITLQRKDIRAAAGEPR